MRRAFFGSVALLFTVVTFSFSVATDAGGSKKDESGGAPTGKASSRPLSGFIPQAEMHGSWGGCSQYLKPLKNPNDYQNRIVFHWGLESSSKPKMHIGGKTVTVQPLTQYPEILMGRAKKGKTFSERYRFGSANMHFDNKITFACPPDSEGGCEVTKFDGVLTVTDAGSRELYQTTGVCGH